MALQLHRDKGTATCTPKGPQPYLLGNASLGNALLGTALHRMAGWTTTHMSRAVPMGMSLMMSMLFK